MADPRAPYEDYRLVTSELGSLRQELRRLRSGSPGSWSGVETGVAAQSGFMPTAAFAASASASAFAPISVEAADLLVSLETDAWTQDAITLSLPNPQNLDVVTFVVSGEIADAEDETIAYLTIEVDGEIVSRSRLDIVDDALPPGWPGTTFSRACTAVVNGVDEAEARVQVDAFTASEDPTPLTLTGLTITNTHN